MARRRILRYWDRQLQRAALWIDGDVDLLALVMRSAIELQFWAQYVSEGEEQARRFVEEANLDLKEIAQRLEPLRPADSEPMPTSPVTTFAKREKVQTSEGLEELTWKFCSKLVHPTSWAINHLDETNDEALRKPIALQILQYSWRIIQTFHHIEWPG